MNYEYLIEYKASKSYSILKHTNRTTINILCYNIVSNKTKYPFLQFMMSKIPFCNNVVTEKLTLPHIIINTNNIENEVLSYVSNELQLLGCEYNKITNNMFKGILWIDNEDIPYAFVNISDINITGLNFTRNSSAWFILTSEIINTKNVCNILIDNDIINLFVEYPELGILNNPITKKYYIIPDSVYTGSEIKNVEFCSIFGNLKTKEISNCREFYYFHSSFGTAVKDGGWLKPGINSKIGDRIIVDSTGKKYVNGGINRYALFVEGKIYFEENYECNLTDEIIDTCYPESCIIIAYTNNNLKSNLLVKNDDSFICLSYHKLDTNTLKEHFDVNVKNKYMIL